MTKTMKQHFINDVLTGLLVAATFAVAGPHDAFAQLSTTVSSSQGQLFAPAMNLLGYGCYAAGAFFGVQGIAGVKKHADSPGQQPLGPGISKLCAGAALLAAPTVIGVIAATGSQAVGGGTGQANTITGF